MLEFLIAAKDTFNQRNHNTGNDKHTYHCKNNNQPRLKTETTFII